MKTNNAILFLFFFFISINVTTAQEGLIGEVKLFAGNFAPRGWKYCDGQSIAINQNQPLFSILGTMYGGDGRTSFKLPKLEGPNTGGTTTSTGQTKSLGGGKTMKVTFVNKTNETVQAHWIDWSGKSHYYGSINSGQSWGLTSGSKQLWRFTHDKKQVRDIVLKDGQNSYDVEPKLNANQSPKMRYIICVSGVYPSRS